MAGLEGFKKNSFPTNQHHERVYDNLVCLGYSRNGHDECYIQVHYNLNEKVHISYKSRTINANIKAVQSERKGSLKLGSGNKFTKNNNNYNENYDNHTNNNNNLETQRWLTKTVFVFVFIGI